MISLLAPTVGLIRRDLRHDRGNAVDSLRHEDPATYACEKGRSERSTHRVPAHILAHACNVADALCPKRILHPASSCINASGQLKFRKTVEIMPGRVPDPFDQRTIDIAAPVCERQAEDQSLGLRIVDWRSLATEIGQHQNAVCARRAF